ncbi:MAG: poly-gamma-glutamate system protein [Tissierellales bacterium]|nr:poly-gamma-glutamate system protein [Tissierellales bacterium]MBN2828627.1 poly-gamma-glutamate system protein [Tissierellales bacterium]
MIKKIHVKLVVVLMLLSVTVFITYHTKEITFAQDYEEKIQAAQLMKEAITLIKEYKLENNILINSHLDINETGIIGDDFTEITTTYGDLESKRTSSNPNFAAVVVDLIHELGLKQGDTVAVNFSGSFPAVNIAVLSALEACEIKAVIISTIGASTYGANHPQLTYLDMENIIWQHGLVKNRSQYFSMGGIDDLGLEFDNETKVALKNRISSYNITYLFYEDFEDNIANRYLLYQDNSKVKAFINVGGNLVSFGKGYTIAYLPGGVIVDLPKNDTHIGLGQSFINDRIPIIHFLNIKDLAKRYALPIDPVPMQDVGVGDIFYRYRYKKSYVFIGILCSFFLLKGIKNENTSKDMAIFIKK